MADPETHEQIDGDSLEVIRQARLVALYLQTLKDCGASDLEASKLTREWLIETFVQAREGD